MLIDFLKTKKTKNELKIALDVLMEFKKNETAAEYLDCPYVSWVKLEQYEEYLKHLVNGEPLQKDTIEFIKKMEENNAESTR